MAHKSNVNIQAKKLRLKGFSYGEISQKLNIAKSTAYLWVNKIELDDKARAELDRKRTLSRLKALKVLKEIRKSRIGDIEKHANDSIKDIRLSKNLSKLLCSFLYWCEGSKNKNSLIFTNSDPNMIRSYLKLLRSSYEINEKKFRALVHVHKYHNEVEIKKFWSKITNIPLSQFSKSYLKSNTKKVIREGYKGTVCIYYYDYRIALELGFIYNRFAESIT